MAAKVNWNYVTVTLCISRQKAADRNQHEEEEEQQQQQQQRHEVSA